MSESGCPREAISITNLVASFALGFVIGLGAQLLLNVTPTTLTAAVTVVATALVFVTQLYAIQASAIAVCMWLKALQDARLADSGEQTSG